MAAQPKTVAALDKSISRFNTKLAGRLDNLARQAEVELRSEMHENCVPKMPRC
jgi:hypothetical protein